MRVAPCSRRRQGKRRSDVCQAGSPWVDHPEGEGAGGQVLLGAVAAEEAAEEAAE